MKNRARRAAAGGVTLTELLVSGFILSLVFSGIASLVSTASRSMTRQDATNTLSNAARASMDEMLLHLRGANKVSVARVVNGELFYSSGSQIVFEAPSYDPAASNVVLAGVSDAVAYTYDGSSRTLSETIAPAAGSVRPVRNRHVIARNVSGVAYSYYARERFRAATTGSVTFTLGGTPLAKPLTQVGGTAAACTYNAVARTFTVNVPTRGAEVQALYAVSPADLAALPLVTQIDVAVTFTGTDAARRTYTFVLPGSARLRNTAH